MRGEAEQFLRDEANAEADVRHGVDGWELASYSRNEDTGVATLRYERTLEDGTREHTSRSAARPSGPQHEGWTS